MENCAENTKKEKKRKKEHKLKKYDSVVKNTN